MEKENDTILFLSSPLREMIWGGKYFKDVLKLTNDNKDFGEYWTISGYSSFPSIIKNGKYKGETLRHLWRRHPELFQGIDDKEFPLLIKIIDAKRDLSIQVHPSDDYAIANYGKLGKTEMWYILESEEDAFIYLGFNDDYPKEVVEKALNEGTITELLNKVFVHPGDFYSIPSGTIHAIGKGVTLYEIQENSDLTFRLYDFDRVDKDGNKRELHIDEALAVLDYSKYDVNTTKKSKARMLTCNKYFELSKFNVYDKIKFRVNDGSFNVLTVIKGQLNLDDTIARRGDSFYIDPSTEINLDGKAELLIARVGDYGVGLDVTLKCPLEGDLFTKLRESNNELTKRIMVYFDRWMNYFHFEKSVLHDPLAVSYLIDNSVLTFKETYARIVLEGEKRGSVEVSITPKEGFNKIHYASSVDKEKFFNIIRNNFE